jgi:hypothetical protein
MIVIARVMIGGLTLGYALARTGALSWRCLSRRSFREV